MNDGPGTSPGGSAGLGKMLIAWLGLRPLKPRMNNFVKKLGIAANYLIQGICGQSKGRLDILLFFEWIIIMRSDLAEQGPVIC